MPVAPVGIIIKALHLFALYLPHTSTRVLSVSHYSSPVQPHRPSFCDNIPWAEQIHWDPLWESQQCECSLMACNGRTVWAVYCCFDKLLMTCMVWGLHAQSECKTTECWGKKWWQVGKKTVKKKRKWEIEPSAALYQTYKCFQGRHGGGWRCFVWRWHQWCQQPVSWLTLLLQTHVPCLVGVTAVISLKCHAMTSTVGLSAAVRYTCREAPWRCRGSQSHTRWELTPPSPTLKGEDSFSLCSPSSEITPNIKLPIPQATKGGMNLVCCRARKSAEGGDWDEWKDRQNVGLWQGRPLFIFHFPSFL